MQTPSIDIPPRGGRSFDSDLQLAVPEFFQHDARWAEDLLGHHDVTNLRQEGCAVTCAAMVLSYFGVDTDPSLLNRFLRERGGFQERGILRWAVAAQLAPEKVRLAHAGPASHEALDAALEAGRPPIVRGRFADGRPHFLVVVGKQGENYQVRDPGVAGLNGIYPLEDFGSPIEAVRIYAAV